MDSSYILAGVVKSAAMHVGLQKPEAMQDFSRTKCQLDPHEMTEMVKAWTACYLVVER